MNPVNILWIIAALLSGFCAVSIGSLTAAQLGYLPMDKTVSVVIILLFIQSCMLFGGIAYASVQQRKLLKILQSIAST